MQILGKRSKVLLIAVAIVMLVAVGVSFAVWDTSAVKATSEDLSIYANAQVGDIIEFGRYYQTGNKVSDAEDAEYEKTPIEWLVVDKNERTGQLTLMSKYILASGSYFGNWYYNEENSGGFHYNSDSAEVGNIPYNQAYVESSVRAYLNNLERFDLGGDGFISGTGYVPSMKDSKTTTGLLSSVGFSNQKYRTGLNYATTADKALVDAMNNGLTKRYEANNNEIYFQCPISNDEYKNRPATRGFLDEAFSNEEKSMIVPKQIAGYTGYRWPDKAHDVSTKSYVEGTVDKVWLASVTELNIINGQDWNEQIDDSWTNPSDESGSTVFEYFMNYQKYGKVSVTEAIKALRTTFAKNSFAMNYSIPVYKKGTTEINTDIHITANATDHYWTRSPSSPWYSGTRTVLSTGLVYNHSTHDSHIGVRPCVILKY